MRKTLFFFVKVFNNKDYANDFIGGKIYANKLSYFRKLEETAEANRGDSNEGVLSWLQPDEIVLEINGRVIGDLAGPVSVQMNWHGQLNVFCIYAAHNGNLKSLNRENITEFKKQLEIPLDCLKLGQYAVVITRANEFLERMKLAIKESGYGYRAGLVEYYDPMSFNGSFSEAEAIFKKGREYEHQREYRFAIDTGIVSEVPLILNIGDISDIAVLCKTDELNKKLEIRFPEGKNA